ncbi:putative permease YjgP/YjgQ family protein [Planctomycetes bacterium Poly30]|uniref:Putative permease YjgP/YjgQ family protein n=1 Tax=Saltatorellus ferox TaxID=2528018 RepID=A0A518EQ89_9BACT|nr:putative permease YjgP/YjgQ family protein [Planctomycetes bacterium Poly30]
MKIHLYILRQLLVAFVFAIAALLFIALPGIAVNTVHKLPNVDAGILLRFLPLILQSLAPYVLPLCFMLSTVAVFGRLAADNEWVAIHMAGIHPLKTLFMPFVLATALGGATYWMVSNELPQLKKRQTQFMVEATASVIKNLQPGKTSLQIGDFMLMAEFRDSRTGIFEGVYLRIPETGDEGEGQWDVFARLVDIQIEERKGAKFLLIDMEDIQVYDPETGDFKQRDKFQSTVNIGERIDKKKNRTYTRAKYLVSSEVRERIASGELDPKQEREYRFMLHYRMSMFAIFYLFLGLGAATGLLMRRGTQLGALAVAAGYGIVYYVFSMRLGQQIGLGGTFPPGVGAWAATVLGGGVAMILLKKAMRR